MRVFVDTNIWLDVVLARSGYADAGAFLLKCSRRNHELWTAWHTLSNLDYILGRAKQTPAQREQHMRDLLHQSRVVATDESDAMFALNARWKDFEDALQFAAARRAQTCPG